MSDSTLAASLTEEALILRLPSSELDFVERKSRSDKGAWLQTAVAFANSVPIGCPQNRSVAISSSDLIYIVHVGSRHSSI
jgi:hypothetical protein